MSGVCIPNMEMPTSCSDCPMCYDMMECTVGTPRIGFWKNEMKAEPFDFCTERHPRCPLIPVPDHGRPIDADALKVSLVFAEKTAERASDGRWLKIDDFSYEPIDWVLCNRCKAKIPDFDYSYCPNCGAKMEDQ